MKYYGSQQGAEVKEEKAENNPENEAVRRPKRRAVHNTEQSSLQNKSKSGGHTEGKTGVDESSEHRFLNYGSEQGYNEKAEERVTRKKRCRGREIIRHQRGIFGYKGDKSRNEEVEGYSCDGRGNKRKDVYFIITAFCEKVLFSDGKEDDVHREGEESRDEQYQGGVCGHFV